MLGSSDENGYYRVEVPQSDTVHLRAELDGYYDDTLIHIWGCRSSRHSEVVIPSDGSLPPCAIERNLYLNRAPSPVPDGSTECSLRGLVRQGAAGQPLESAIVEVSPGGHRTLSDASGSYSLQIPQGQNQLRVQLIGFSVQTHDLYVTCPSDNATLEFNIWMRVAR